ncbi:MAG TPA: phosphopantetheine-binding protein [Cyanobacteria bacterium UBA8543]|nr:phosphopantetheine-binding protein [Cyanobacteria bacterium UBA8543]
MEIQNLQVKTMPTTAESFKADNQSDAPNEPLSKAEIQAWIVSYLAQLLEIDPDEVYVTIPFDQYGLDSSAAVGMTGDLEDWMGQKIDPTLLYDYPTIEALAQHLAE